MPKPESLERPKSIEEFQKMFRRIYHELNARYYKKNEELIARLNEEITYLMEHARKDRRSAFREQLANIFSWHMAVANRLGIDIQEALWYKYPGVCPYCLREKDCICGTEHPVVEDKERKLCQLRQEYAGHEPQTIIEHQAFHRRLYGWQHDRELPIIIAAHIVEEGGEVSHAYRHFTMARNPKEKDCWRNRAREEMADVFSWMFALANRLEFDLADAVWEYYPYECVKCHEGPCVCKEIL